MQRDQDTAPAESVQVTRRRLNIVFWSSGVIVAVLAIGVNLFPWWQTQSALRQLDRACGARRLAIDPGSQFLAYEDSASSPSPISHCHTSDPDWMEWWPLGCPSPEGTVDSVYLAQLSSPGQAMDSLHKLPGLRVLHLRGPISSQTSLSSLQMCKLEEVVFERVGLGDAASRSISEIKTIRCLSLIADSVLSDESLAHFATLPKLEMLRLQELPMISSSGLKSMAHSRSLGHLTISDCDIDQTTIETIVEFKQLKVLQVREHDLSDIDFSSLNVLPELRVVRLRSTTDADYGGPPVSKGSFGFKSIVIKERKGA